MTSLDDEQSASASDLLRVTVGPKAITIVCETDGTFLAALDRAAAGEATPESEPKIVNVRYDPVTGTTTWEEM